MKDERANTSMLAKGIMLLNPPESNCTNNYLALSKTFATMTHQVTHQVAHRVIAHGLFCKMRNIRSPYFASCGIVLFEGNKRAKVFQGAHWQCVTLHNNQGANTAQQPTCTHCRTTKAHTLHNNQGAHTARQLSQSAIWQSCSQKKDKNTSLQRENNFKRENDMKCF